jgi:lysophospholipase L1-like esterase
MSGAAPAASPSTAPPASASTAATGGGGLPEKSTVAFIGDSHTAGPFGRDLKSKLQAQLSRQGGTLASFQGVTSSSAASWMPRVDSVLNQLKGKSNPVLAVALGTNMLKNSPAENTQQIKGLLEKADRAGVKVAWIGPPRVRGFAGSPISQRNEEQFYQALRGVNAERSADRKMTIVDSRGSTSPSQTVDGVHFDAIAAKRWASQVFAELMPVGAASSTRFA